MQQLHCLYKGIAKIAVELSADSIPFGLRFLWKTIAEVLVDYLAPVSCYIIYKEEGDVRKTYIALNGRCAKILKTASSVRVDRLSFMFIRVLLLWSRHLRANR